MEQGSSQFRLIFAGTREAGVRCAHCDAEIVTGAEVAQCVRCGTAHHKSCWESRGGCGSYDCAPGRRVVVISGEQLSAPVNSDDAGRIWKLTAEDLDRAIPLPEPRPAFAGGSFSSSSASMPRTDDPRSLRMSRLAVAALIVGIAGIPLFGLVTGIAAIILACIALSTIDTTRMRGTSLAAIGLLLGFVDIVLWIVLIAYWQGGSTVTAIRPPLSELDPAALEAVDPAIADAMRANVIISSHKLLSERMGSGVVVKLENGEAHIVTNRHVIDGSYTGEGDTAKPEENSDSGSIMVRMLGQAPVPAKLMWTAPGGVDLAIVKVDCKSLEVRVARCPAPKVPKIGDSAFAVGNPHALGWSLSPGSISQIRKWEHDLIVIQTTAPINSGNSGGGLYDKDGFLIGVNTWTESKQVSEGLGFAISAESLLKVAPAEMLSGKPPAAAGQNRIEVELSPTTTPTRVAP